MPIRVVIIIVEAACCGGCRNKILFNNKNNNMFKHTKKIGMLLLMAAAMMITSCTKEEPANNNSSPTPEAHGRLYGTRWTKNYTEHFMDEGYYQDHYYVYKCSATLHFMTNNSGERTLSKDIYDEIQQVTTGHHSDTVAHFTYVYNGGDSQYGPGILYWDNGDSSIFYVNSLYGGDNIYIEGEEFPDYSTPVYLLDD